MLAGTIHSSLPERNNASDTPLAMNKILLANILAPASSSLPAQLARSISAFQRWCEGQRWWPKKPRTKPKATSSAISQAKLNASASAATAKVMKASRRITLDQTRGTSKRSMEYSFRKRIGVL